jgi:predicted O-linked N-acetylglucosamine transferase (SPINDLY family)
VTALELVSDAANALDNRAWLLDFLMAHAGEDIPDGRLNRYHERLALTPFTEIVDVIERSGGAAGPRATIRLYQLWISGQPPGAAHLFAAWFNLGVAFSQIGDKKHAITAYQAALALRPDLHSAAINLGLALESLGQNEAALQAWHQALQPDDARTTLLNHRARLFEQLNRLDVAEQEMRRSLLINSNQPDVIQHWVHIRQKMCEWPVLTEVIPGLRTNDLLRHVGPLSALALCDDIDIQREAAKDWIKRKTFQPNMVLSPASGYHHDRIRLGYLSSDFCRHAMSYLIAELFESHDRDQFEVFGYCSSPEDGSDIRLRVIRSFDHFRKIKHLSDDQAARLIREDEIDILVDLNGLTSGARPQILRWRPAPVQATYLGFIGPVPLPELDYMFCDDIVVPPELASAYEPTPLYIAENYQVNDNKRTIGQATTRAAVGLPDDKFIFCCFSNYYKMTEEVFSAWMTILERCDNSVIWLTQDNEWACRNLLEYAASRGMDRDRLIFTRRVGPDEYMARLPLADLFLDTFPYNAGTIASDAIRMGLPLLTTSGQAFASRMACRLLMAIGAHQGIATNASEYIELAVSLATNKSAFDAYKSIFEVETWRRQIGDITKFSRAYENTLRVIAKRGRAEADSCQIC